MKGIIITFSYEILFDIKIWRNQLFWLFLQIVFGGKLLNYNVIKKEA